MEDTLRVSKSSPVRRLGYCLNPCFNGRYSQSAAAKSKRIIFWGLNPCFNGRYSQSSVTGYICKDADGLNPCFNGRYSQRDDDDDITSVLAAVLILVLMEDTLREQRLVSLCLSSFDVCLPL